MQEQWVKRAAQGAFVLATLDALLAFSLSTDQILDRLPGPAARTLGSIAMAIPWLLLLSFICASQVSTGRVPVLFGRPRQDMWLVVLALCMLIFAFWPELSAIASLPIIGARHASTPGMFLSLICLLMRVLQLRQRRDPFSSASANASTGVPQVRRPVDGRVDDL